MGVGLDAKQMLQLVVVVVVAEVWQSALSVDPQPLLGTRQTLSSEQHPAAWPAWFLAFGASSPLSLTCFADPSDWLVSIPAVETETSA